MKMGYELYYGLMERILSGSVGVSMNLDSSRPIILNASSNPIIGSFHFDVAAKIGVDNLWARSYMDYNIHNSSSDFGLAIKYSNQQQETLQARISRSKVLKIPVMILAYLRF